MQKFSKSAGNDFDSNRVDHEILYCSKMDLLQMVKLAIIFEVEKLFSKLILFSIDKYKVLY
jgi:hypothetical protein